MVHITEFCPNSDQLLEEVCALGRDPNYVCQKTTAKTEQPAAAGIQNISSANSGVSSDDDDEEDDVASTHSGTVTKQPQVTITEQQWV